MVFTWRHQWKLIFIQIFASREVVGFVIEYAWISKLLRDATFTWRPRDRKRAVIRVKKMTYIRKFCYLNSSCIRKSITLIVCEFLEEWIHTFVAKLGNRCFCWFQSAMLELIQVSTSMVSPYKSLLSLGPVWVKHFFGYLVYEKFLRPESWRGSLHTYLLSFLRFWTLSIERFWFLFRSILDGVTLKTSNRSILCLPGKAGD